MSANHVPVAKLTSPADIVAMIPYVLGFVPGQSLVLVALEGARRRFGPVLRIDLAETSREMAEQVDYLIALVEAHRFGEVLVVAYSDDARRSGAVVRPLVRRLKRLRVGVPEAIRADGERWFSYTCHKVCCPPGGVPYEPDTTSAVAESVYSGMTRAENRDALRSMFDPGPPEIVSSIAADCRTIMSDIAAGRIDDAEVRGHLASMGDNNELPVALVLALAQDESWVSVFLTSMTRTAAHRHFEVWRAVMRAAPDDLMAGPGALTAFAAWLDGHGVLASHACERVEAVAPGHSLIVLVRSLLDHTVPPYVWDEISCGEWAFTT